jgi:hypothetical protein
VSPADWDSRPGGVSSGLARRLQGQVQKTARLASAPELEQATGRYFAGGKPSRSSKRSYDQAAAARLWQVSADLAGLTAAASR